MKYATRDCSCEVITGTGGRRPEKCPCGNRFQTEAELRSSFKFGPRTYTPEQAEVIRRTVKNRKPLKQSEPKRDWSLALAKIDEEGGCCRVCGHAGTEAAHILGRKYDQPISPGSKTLLVLPDRIVPLCGRYGDNHHAQHDAHELDLLPYLTAAEQAQAILDAGSIGLALRRISPGLELVAA